MEGPNIGHQEALIFKDETHFPNRAEQKMQVAKCNMLTRLDGMFSRPG